MKRTVITFIIAMFGLSPVYAQTKWESVPLKDSLVKAKVLNRKIFIEFYASWCPTCIKLEREVFQREPGSRISKEFLCHQYDAEKGEGKDLAKKHSVISYPTIIILDKNGEEIDRILDYEDPSSFIKLVFDYAEGKGVITALENLLEKSPEDIPLLYTVGEKYAFRGDEEKANKYLNRIIEFDPKNAKGYSDKALFTLARFLYLRSLNNYQKALALFTELDNQYPESPLAKQTDIERAKIFLMMEKKEDAYKALENFLVKNKSDSTADAYNSFAWFCYRNNFRMEDGLNVAKDGIKINPKSDGLYDTMAVLYSSLGEHDKAVSSIRKALELKPKDIYYQTQLERLTAKREENVKKK